MPMAPWVWVRVLYYNCIYMYICVTYACENDDFVFQICAWWRVELIRHREVK
jgi:hypothetical protein